MTANAGSEFKSAAAGLSRMMKLNLTIMWIGFKTVL